ncbi:MAG: hypothetical protein II902_11725 [Selenomonadaceae bacterium]|nr:hypothetical protein [Selenomonadaceae bacterium]
MSQTCTTYPRRTFSFGKFFERSLTLTCPVAAEMILFAREPLKFEFVEVPETIHGKHGRIHIQKISTNERRNCPRNSSRDDFHSAGAKIFNLLAANFEKLTNARKNFSEKYSTFPENYLVNELFHAVYPWRFREHSITKNFAVFLISYKIFELVTFAATESGLDSKENLPALIDWFMSSTDHSKDLYKRFLELPAGVDDAYLLMATLL